MEEIAGLLNDNNNFFLLKVKHWKSIENRRNFFIEFASQKGFDPLVYGNWDKRKKEIIARVSQ